MPSRILRESIATSESVASMTPEAQDRLPRYFLLPDDFGCFLVHPAVVKGKIWPLRPDMTDQRIESDLAEFEKAGILQIYRGPDGRGYGYFPGWNDHQRPARATAKRKYPKPPDKPLLPEPPGKARQSPEPPGESVSPAKPGEAGESPAKPASSSSSSSSSNLLSQSSRTHARESIPAEKPAAADQGKAQDPDPPLVAYLREDWPDLPDPSILAAACAKAFPAVDLLAAAKSAKSHLVAGGNPKQKPPAAFLRDWFAREARGPPLHAGPVTRAPPISSNPTADRGRTVSYLRDMDQRKREVDDVRKKTGGKAPLSQLMKKQREQSAKGEKP